MGRPATHTEDDFVDAAIGLFATGGSRAVTMNAVARVVGAPSGSIFHRFPTRPALLAAVWLRTTRRFQAGYLEQVGGTHPSIENAVAATVWVVEWCRADLPAAFVLQAGVCAFDPEDWPASARVQREALDAERDRLTKRLIADLADQTALPQNEIAFVLFDLPLAAVRRHLLDRKPPGPGTVTVVRNLATRLLTDTGESET